MSYSIKCGLCWEEKCEHWRKASISSTSSILKRTILTDCLVCAVCENNHKVKPIFDITTFICPCNMNSVYYSSNSRSITINDLLYYNNNKYVRSKCRECKGSGKVLKEKFTPCTNCHGIGGVCCKRCKGLGDGDGRGCYNYASQSKCKLGFEIICYVCDGSKLVVSGKSEVDCKSCIVKSIS